MAVVAGFKEGLMDLKSCVYPTDHTGHLSSRLFLPAPELSLCPASVILFA